MCPGGGTIRTEESIVGRITPEEQDRRHRISAVIWLLGLMVAFVFALFGRTHGPFGTHAGAHWVAFPKEASSSDSPGGVATVDPASL